MEAQKYLSRNGKNYPKHCKCPLEEIFENEDNNIFIFQDNSTGNYSGTNNIYSIPQYIEELLETQKKYIERLEKEIKELKSKI
ncbi:hypothetical protein [Chryseobacterium sp. RU37D]|uniref:hypothetical protein n=1 Tax=Chryseobacterium sp. RU37D TaxID=1907397 RepID=UPI00117EEB0D|nr:hypothetical protein [Chryseobacterium sp. RU37D]